MPADSTTGGPVRVGPVALMPGVARLNFWTYMFAAFICIAMLAGMNFLQVYLLDVHLRIPPAEQGSVTGLLAFCTEMVALMLIVPFGVLADRTGRRPLMVFGLLVCGLGYALFPFASSVTELVLYRLLFAVGAAALAALLAVVGNDYTQESSRGRLFGFSGVMNGLGVIFMSAGLAQIPTLLEGAGYTPVQAGTGMFLTAAALCVLAAGAMQLGLVGGRPAKLQDRQPAGTLLRAGLNDGLSAGRNPRILLSYLAAFAGRSDNAIKGLFVSAWVLQVAALADISAPEALGQAGRLMGLMGVVTLVWVPIFGFILDRLNRVTGMALAMGLAGAGYLSMGIITSPLDSAMLPAFVLLAIGQGSAITASVTLVGQEAPPEQRGVVVAMNGWFGALGILLASLAGGVLFDRVGPAAPFVLIGAFQALVMVLALIVRVRAPGEAGVTRSAA